MKWRIVLGIVVVAGLIWMSGGSSSPEPPAPPDLPAELDLRGAFRGGDAAVDAATLACLSEEIASCLEFDGRLPSPMLTTATAFDELRTRARVWMCRGSSLGEKHPAARDIIGGYLDSKIGTGGGEVTPDIRAAWVHCYRQIARACRAAIEDR